MPNTREESGINPKEIIAIILKRKWLLIIPTIIISAIAYSGVYFLTPKYQSSTIVWIDKPSNMSRELSNIIGARRETRDDIRNKQIALQTEITSKGYLVQLIDQLDLDSDEDIIRSATRLLESVQGYTLEQIKVSLLLEELREHISVSFIGTEQFKITIESHSAELARDMAKNLTEIMEREKSRYEMEKILNNQDFTDLQLQKSEFEYRLLMDSLNDARSKLTKLQLPESISSEDNRLEILSSLDKIKLDINDYENDQNVLSNQLKAANLHKKKIKLPADLVEIRANINVFIANFSRMMEKYSWNDQNVVNINIRINDNVRQLELGIAEEVKRKFSSLPINQIELLSNKFIIKENIDILNSKLNRLEQTIEKLNERINSIPTVESEISELQIKVASARRYRDAFKDEETTVGILSEQMKERTKYKVIEPAQVPLAPFWPDQKKLVILGFILGIALGGGAILLIEILDSSYNRVEDLEDDLGLKVIAVISKIDKFNIAR